MIRWAWWTASITLDDGIVEVFLDSEEDIARSIDYVNGNPAREEKKKQTWSFVSKYTGD